MRLRSTTIWLLFAAFCLSAGGAVSAGESEAQRAPETTWPTTSWPVSSAEEQGMDSAGLARLIETVGTYKQDNLTIIRHGKIVADAYYAPYAAGISHDLRSVTKSIVSTLTAIELKQGLLDSVDHPVLDLFADKHIANIDDNKKAMTVQHLLDMTSGFEWQEKNYSPDETIMRMYQGARPHRIRAEPADVERAGHQILLQQRQPLCAVGADHEKDRQQRVRFCQEGAVRTARHHQRQMGQGRCARRHRWRSRIVAGAARYGAHRLSLSSRRDVGWKADHSVILGGARQSRHRSGDRRHPLFEPVVVVSGKGRLYGARPSLPDDPCDAEAGCRRRHDRYCAG